MRANTQPRLVARIQSHAYHTVAYHPSMRDYPFLGSAQITPGLPVPCQASPAADSNLPLFQSYTVCSLGQLSTIQQGGCYEPR